MSGTVSFDIFTGAFLSKISEFEFAQLSDEARTASVDGYMSRALAAFQKNCKYSLVKNSDNDSRSFFLNVKDEDLEELVDIISDGMIVQWLKPYLYQQENLENVLNTRDFSAYSPATLLQQVRETYTKAQKDFVQGIREYSFKHGDLKSLHL